MTRNPSKPPRVKQEKTVPPSAGLRPKRLVPKGYALLPLGTIIQDGDCCLSFGEAHPFHYSCIGEETRVPAVRPVTRPASAKRPARSRQKTRNPKVTPKSKPRAGKGKT